MGFWQGVAKATSEISEENFRRKEQERQREFQSERDEDAFKKQKLLADYKAKLETRQALLLEKVKDGRASASASSDTIANDLAKLKAIGVSEENISRIQQSGNAKAIGDITKEIMSKYESAAEISSQMAQEFKLNLNPFLSENLVVDPSSEETFSIDGLDEVFTTTVPGAAAVVLEPAVAPAEASEIKFVEERIIGRTQRAANSELTKLNSALTEISKRMEGSQGSGRALLESAASVLRKRLELVQSAVESESFEPLLQIYGTAPVDATLEAFGGTVSRDVLDPAFNEEYTPADPFDFSGKSELEVEALQTLFRRLNLG